MAHIYNGVAYETLEQAQAARKKDQMEYESILAGNLPHSAKPLEPVNEVVAESQKPAEAENVSESTGEEAPKRRGRKPKDE